MTGIQEILTLIMIIAGIVVLPRMFKKEKTTKPRGKKITLSGTLRLGLVASILIPVISAFFFRPWDQRIDRFILTAIFPVALGWGVFWVISGFRKKGK
ncbi:MAG: hypothetical protein U9P10_02120 [Thermodesulfobacteriota bacterium]|nr:hypothetical protein [Thermodesulfobacteriota bacterium]